MGNHIMKESIPENEKNEWGYPISPSRDRTGRNMTAGWVFVGFRASHGTKKALWKRVEAHPAYAVDEEE